MTSQYIISYFHPDKIKFFDRIGDGMKFKNQILPTKNKGGVFSKVKMKSRNGHDFKETTNVSNFVEIVLVSC